MSTTVPTLERTSRMLGCMWLAPGLGEPRCHKEAIHFSPTRDSGVGLAFDSLEDLDAVIGELTAARYKVASDRRATSPAEGRCPDGVEVDQAKAVQR